MMVTFVCGPRTSPPVPAGVATREPESVLGPAESGSDALEDDVETDVENHVA
jgi:hypothetical protein